MPKKRQIPFLLGRPAADGTTIWHWKPSVRLRTAGFHNIRLGTDYADACRQAIGLNEAVAAWEAGSRAATERGAPLPPRPLPRLIRFDELRRTYERSDDFTGLKDSTRREYRTRLNQLEYWADDGRLPVRQIDDALVRDLRNTLVAGASKFRAASTLRVLRLLLQFAEREGIIPKKSNPAREIKIPEPPKRKTQMSRGARGAIVEAAHALGLDHVALAVEIAFWSLQRQADVLALTRLAWREIDLPSLELDPRHAARLVGPTGKAMGFRLCQQKTGTWVDAPAPPFLHPLIEARLKASNHGFLFADRTNPDQSFHPRTFHRDFTEAQQAAWAVAIMEERDELADQIAECTFRDLRRTGMIFYKDAGAQVPNITALSGHAVLGVKTIMDDYMPGDTAGACACVATGLRALYERESRNFDARELKS